MGFKTGRILKSDIFKPIELNEGNVQAIFNRCLVNKNSKNISTTILFSEIMGYSKENEVVINFDKDILLENKSNIEYLYGQLNVIHTEANKRKRLSVNDFKTDYVGNVWSQSKSSLLELLYLGINSVSSLGYPFSKVDGDTTIISRDIKPTLSPKDPNFPAWWEEHKSEWEEAPKKEN